MLDSASVGPSSLPVQSSADQGGKLVRGQSSQVCAFPRWFSKLFAERASSRRGGGGYGGLLSRKIFEFCTSRIAGNTLIY